MNNELEQRLKAVEDKLAKIEQQLNYEKELKNKQTLERFNFESWYRHQEFEFLLNNIPKPWI